MLKGILPSTIQLLELIPQNVLSNWPIHWTMRNGAGSTCVSIIANGCSSIPVDLHHLLKEYEDIFKAPIGLPLPLQDHKIPLKDDTLIVKIRPIDILLCKKMRWKSCSRRCCKKELSRTAIALFSTPTVMVKNMVAGGYVWSIGNLTS